MTSELFENYLDGKCTLEEAKAVVEWIHNSDSESLDAMLLPIWNTKNAEMMPHKNAIELWKNISELTAYQQYKQIRIKNLVTVRAAVAAAIAAFIIIGIVWTISSKQSNDIAVNEHPVNTVKQNEWTAVTNNNTESKQFTLADGSKVMLFAGAVIKYPLSFSKDARPVYLEGKALFTVAKDADRPFTVYNKDVATTALGTKFLVEENKDDLVLVKLFEGKVVIRPASNTIKWVDKVLLPGDIFTYNKTAKQVSVQQYKNNDRIKTNDRTGAKNELNFVNAELDDVFEVLNSQYQNEISYNKNDITGMYFTGIISQTQSLEKVLDIITQMNGLHVVKQKSKYIIQKN
jgi:transmembrane sensor